VDNPLLGRWIFGSVLVAMRDSQKPTCFLHSDHRACQRGVLLPCSPAGFAAGLAIHPHRRGHMIAHFLTAFGFLWDFVEQILGTTICRSLANSSID
jgi:hypothetical protein